MDNNIIQSIDKFIAENERSIVRDIGRLVAINSVLDMSTASVDKPFGEGPAKALELGLEIAKELGLDTYNCENYIGYASIGDNKDYLATIAHLDVVPAGEGWTGDPFTLREREGYLIGRGVMDDKGPSVLTLYALKFLKEAGIPMRFKRNRKQVSVVAICNKATLCVVPFLNEGRVSVSTPTSSCVMRYSTALSASASV